MIPEDLITYLKELAAQETSEDTEEDAKRFHAYAHDTPWDPVKYDPTDGESHHMALYRGKVDGETKLARYILKKLSISFDPYEGPQYD